MCEESGVQTRHIFVKSSRLGSTPSPGWTRRDKKEVRQGSRIVKSEKYDVCVPYFRTQESPPLIVVTHDPSHIKSWSLHLPTPPWSTLMVRKESLYLPWVPYRNPPLPLLVIELTLEYTSPEVVGSHSRRRLVVVHFDVLNKNT